MAQTASTLLLEEFFEAGDERFLAELLACEAAGPLKSLAPRWAKDERPFARQMLLRYIDDGCDRPHHRPLVKALLKHFDAAGDDEVMAHFLAAFDRLVRRRIVESNRYVPAAGQWLDVKTLRSDSGAPQFDPQRGGFQQAFAKKAKLPISKHTLPRFAIRTRYYLQRRAFRYFRAIGRQDPARYRKVLGPALALYEDAHLQRPEQLLDARGLVTALYWGSPVLERTRDGIRVADGETLANMQPAPLYPEAWKGCRDELVALLLNARSRTVRNWIVRWLKREYPATELQKIPATTLRTLLSSPVEEVQVFAAELLKTATGLESLPLSDWMKLLRIENPAVVTLLCELVEKHVTPNRLTLTQCVDLACQPIAPVGELGLKWAKTKPIRAMTDVLVVMQLGSARTASVRTQAAAWLSELLATSTFAQDEHLRELIDSRFEETRTAALTLFTKEPKFRDSTKLWSALAESPYDDARTLLVQHLNEREKALQPDALRHLWATTLLGVHRGGRAKQLVLKRVAERIASQPTEAEQLVPLLSIALRSVRAPERRSALAAVAVAASRTPALKATLAQQLPELVLHEGVPA